MSTPENQRRLKLGEFPEGAEIVPNPYNKIPGFSVRGEGNSRLVCLPGFPIMAWPMLEAVLDEQYAVHFHTLEWKSKAMLVHGLVESAIIPLMEQVEKQFVPVKTFSLPSMGDGGEKPHIELGCKVRQVHVAKLIGAFEFMQTAVVQLGGTFVEV